MKILVANDSFKGTLTSNEACQAVKRGLLSVNSDLDVSVCPVADGGEGTVNAMASTLGGEIITVNVTGPFGKAVEAHYCLAGDTAVIEMAEASGITLQPTSELNPLVATTYGTGELLKHAIASGAKRIIIGIGGSATNDGGVGCIRALGGSFTDKDGNELREGGAALSELANFDFSEAARLFENVELLVACDVVSPLCNENGASRVFARQKGASDEDIETLESALKHYGELVCEKLGKDYMNMAGAGAAGGLGFALVAFLGGKLRSGFDIIVQTVELEKKISECDILITGEGKTDSSSLLGKLPVKMSTLAKKYGKRCFLMSGDITCTADELNKHFDYFDRARLSTDTPDEAMSNAESRLYDASKRAAKAI